MAVLTFLYLFCRAAPYGCHYAGAGWGPHISTRLAWVIMELPAPALFLVVYLDGKGAFQIVPLL
ncbi:MAG: 3-oxo-5-alpha-steroid 4-dehydrogenase, partial [Candidatus Tectomicrobia bacterium]|nr:3-oxo-5-alpha-steroid 4-dehydrogenase [Candidatus Tectomicrobia bacterium]